MGTLGRQHDCRSLPSAFAIRAELPFLWLPVPPGCWCLAPCSSLRYPALVPVSRGVFVLKHPSLSPSGGSHHPSASGWVLPVRCRAPGHVCGAAWCCPSQGVLCSSDLLPVLGSRHLLSAGSLLLNILSDTIMERK